MKPILKLYRYCNYLSLDVACGAMVCAAFFARILHVQLLPYGLASLGLTVWIIYTTDHLLDAKKLKQEASSQRHRFHQNNFRLLLITLLTAILFDLLLVCFVRKPILYWGIGLSVIVLLYLWLEQRLIIFKELVVSFLYTAGIVLPAMSLTTVSLSTPEILLILSFAVTALINLVLFSWYDWKEDAADRHFSLVTRLGRYKVKAILIILFIVQAFLIVDLILISMYKLEAFVMAAMNLPLFILLLFPRCFADQNIYRVIGDGVFILPLLYLVQ